MLSMRRACLVAIVPLSAGCVTGYGAGGGADGEAVARAADPGAVYWVYVGAESADLIHRIRFDGTLSVEQTTMVGEIPTETEGPHGLRISPDGRHLFMTTGHGFPDGKLWKFEAGVDTVVAEPILLGYFPATIDLTPDGLYAFVVNFNLHGEHVPSTVSVVYTPDLVEVEQVETCTMPHGARMAPDGLFLYSNCMMDEQVVEIDTRTFQVARRFSVAPGREGPFDPGDGAGAMARGMSGMAGGAVAGSPCSPTWVQPSPDGLSLYVACNAGSRILHIDRGNWELTRVLQAGTGPYNLAITPDGRLLVATLKQGAGVEFFDLRTGESLARVPTTTTVTHGVEVSPDSRYAFVSSEGVGAEPGKVDVFDLSDFSRVGDVEVGQQAGGIAFWKMESPRSTARGHR